MPNSGTAPNPLSENVHTAMPTPTNPSPVATANQLAPADVRLLLVDDHTIVREGLRALLTQTPGIAVVGEAGTGAQALAAAAQLQPDVVILDLNLPDLPGTVVLQQLAQVAPQTRTLVLSMHDGPEYVWSAIQAGAVGYLVKGSGLQDLVAAIFAVDRGHGFFSPAAAASLSMASGSARPPVAGSDHERLAALSPRERQVLQLVALGLTSAKIGEQLAIAAKTVEAHRANLSAKLGIADVPALVKFAVRVGMVPLGG